MTRGNNMKRFSILFLLIILATSVSTSFAQGRGGGRGGNGTPPPPPSNLADRAAQAIGQLPNTENIAESLQIPEDWSNFTIPEDLPATLDDIVAELETLELPDEFDIAALLDGLDLSQFNSQAAIASIIGFAETHLGTTVSPIIAGDTQQLEATELYQQVITQLPVDAQQILMNASGIGYYAILEDGVGVVYTVESCNSPNCAVDLGQLQFNITTASLGTYARYRTATVPDANAAYSLLISTYPQLAYYTLTPIQAEAGFAFSAVDYGQSNAIAYFAGVIEEGGNAVVYVVAGIGDGYINLIPQN